MECLKRLKGHKHVYFTEVFTAGKYHLTVFTHGRIFNIQYNFSIFWRSTAFLSSNCILFFDCFILYFSYNSVVNLSTV